MNNKEEYINAVNEIKVDENLKRKALNRIKSKKQINFPYKLANAMAFVLIIFCIIFITDDTKIGDIVNPENSSINQEYKLPTVDNIQNLLSILKSSSEQNYNKDSMRNESVSSTESILADTMDEKKLYSTTNTQVKGIDEADIVKADGEYIYYISGNKLVILQAGENFKIVSEIEYESKEKEYIEPIEMYIDGEKLIIILTKRENSLYELCDVLYQTGNITKTITYDITNKEKPVVYREFEIEGNYITSRMLDKTIYLITDEHILYDEKESDEKNLTQKYTDSTIGEERNIELSNISYVPDKPDNSYLNITAFDTQTKRKAEITTILGAGNDVYMSNGNIYVTKNDFYSEISTIYKFSVNKTIVEYVAKTEVKGRVINQFSMDEYNGNFRVATTQLDNGINNLYIYDETLNEIGKIENLAEGERIYSVRFIGDKGYIVTFKEVDPLFVIDLSDEKSPKVLGELKIPGYSTYLHPYDETHIIGFGEDTKIEKDAYGNENIIATGVKMALFDITNPTSPKELFSTKIGDSATYSSVLYNHKSLLFSKEKNILAFPITINKDEEAAGRTKLIFQGAIIYEIDLANGFKEKGRIAHMQINNGYKDYDYKQEVERIIYINNDLYTLSPGTVKRTDLNTMKELNKVEIKLNEKENMVIVN